MGGTLCWLLLTNHPFSSSCHCTKCLRNIILSDFSGLLMLWLSGEEAEIWTWVSYIQTLYSSNCIDVNFCSGKHCSSQCNITVSRADRPSCFGGRLLLIVPVAHLCSKEEWEFFLKNPGDITCAVTLLKPGSELPETLWYFCGAF